MIFKKKNGTHNPDDSGKPTESIDRIKIYVCEVCAENVGEKKYACSSLREAQELKCINAGYNG